MFGLRVEAEICPPYARTFTHPIPGAKLERKISGLADGKCVTMESMPGKHKMKSAFPPDMRKAVATFFNKTQAAEAAGVEERPAVNPLQQAVEAGVCGFRQATV